MSLTIRNPLPPGSYAYCEPTCGWRDDTPAAEANGLLHSQALQHVVHVYVPECGDVHIEDGHPFSCKAEAGHGGDHHIAGARRWPVTEEVEGMSPIDPDCAAGKHTACPGWTWDDDTDLDTDCTCPCHEED